MKKVLKTVSICFIVAAMLTAGAFAAAPVKPDQPQASEYILHTSTAIVALGGGKIEIDYDITATDEMKDVGALQVDIYEVGTGIVWSHHYEDLGYGYLMGHNTGSYSRSVTYDKAKSKCTYYAIMKFFAGEHGVAGDIHVMDTVYVTMP